MTEPDDLAEQPEDDREALLEHLRREIAIGLEEAKAGQLSDGEAFFEELRRKIVRRDPR